MKKDWCRGWCVNVEEFGHHPSCTFFGGDQKKRFEESIRIVQNILIEVSKASRVEKKRMARIKQILKNNL